MNAAEADGDMDDRRAGSLFVHNPTLRKVLLQRKIG